MKFKAREFESIDEVNEYLEAMGSEFIIKEVSLDTRTSNKKTIYTVLMKYELSYLKMGGQI